MKYVCEKKKVSFLRIYKKIFLNTNLLLLQILFKKKITKFNLLAIRCNLSNYVFLKKNMTEKRGVKKLSLKIFF